MTSSTDPTTTLTGGGVQPVIDTAYAAAGPQPLDPDGRFFLANVLQGHDACVIDLEGERDAYREEPRRKTGSYQVHDADSFVAYLTKHGDEQSEVWADTQTARITGVLNANTELAPQWEDHRVVYAVLLTDAWKAWAEKDGRMLSQQEFAEHIEDRAIDVRVPAAADMLELAQTFQATMGVDFQSSQVLSSGERKLTYRENVDAKAGRTGQLEIPASFTLALVPFEGADPFRVTARLRYRITDGTLRLGYRLERPADVLREAFLTVVNAIDEQTAPPTLRGAAPGATRA